MACLIKEGRLFQSVGPVAAKAQSPRFLSLTLGTTVFVGQGHKISSF